MLKSIQQFFERNISIQTHDPGQQEHALQLATAALLMEMTIADSAISDAERKVVEENLQRVFTLTDDETRKLSELAEQEAEEATSLYQFTGIINREYTPAEKVLVVEMLWRVAFSDGRLDPNEEHLVRKLAGLLHVPHREFIQSKHRVEEELSGG